MCIVRQSVIKESCMILLNSKTNVRSKCLYCYLSNHLNNDQIYNSAIETFFMWSSNYFGSNYIYVGLNFLFNQVQLSFERYGQQLNAL